MDSQLSLVYTFLDTDQNENALFLAERLRATHVDEPRWVHLQALACLRLGRYALAAEYTKEEALAGKHLGCSYIYALASLYGGKYTDGITALKASMPLWAGLGLPGADKAPPERFSPEISALNCALGQLYHAAGDTEMAVKYLVAGLEANPFMWHAFSELCDIGVSLQVPNVFKFRDTQLVFNESRPVKAAKLASDGAAAPKQNTSQRRSPLESTILDSAQPRIRGSPEPLVGDENRRRPDLSNPATDAARTKLMAPSRKRQRSVFENGATESLGVRPAPGRPEYVERARNTTAPLAPQRRSVRLLNQGAPHPGSTERSSSYSGSHGERLGKPTKPRPNTRPATLRKASIPARLDIGRASLPPTEHGASVKSHAPNSSAPATSSQRRGGITPTSAKPHPLQDLLDLFLQLGTAYYHLSRFKPKSSLEAFSTLPAEQRATLWVLSKMGRAHYELMAYNAAKTTFEALRKQSSAWIEDLDVYSTVLWHLKEDVPLALLAHELTEDHFLSPETWCAVGNSYSVQRLHREAIRCFRRACQLSPSLPHAFSLLGYEYMEMEEYADAKHAFREALLLDARHYLAWVGLGRVEEKIGQGAKALKYYIGAEKINPSNAVLLTYIARAFEKSNNPTKALPYLHRASALSPPKPIQALIKVQSATIHLSLHHPAEAISDLDFVRQIAPDEPHVHFLLGRAHAMSGPSHRADALRCFTLAKSLAPLNEDVKLAMTRMETEV